MPGETETALLWKIGVPLAIRLAGAGKDEAEAVKEARTAMESVAKGDIDIGGALLEANEEQTESIIDGLFGLITGIPQAFGKLIGAIFGLFK